MASLKSPALVKRAFYKESIGLRDKKWLGKLQANKFEIVYERFMNNEENKAIVDFFK